MVVLVLRGGHKNFSVAIAEPATFSVLCVLLEDGGVLGAIRTAAVLARFLQTAFRSKRLARLRLRTTVPVIHVVKTRGRVGGSTVASAFDEGLSFILRGELCGRFGVAPLLDAQVLNTVPVFFRAQGRRRFDRRSGG